MRRFRFFGQSAAPILALALLIQQDRHWSASLPLTAPKNVSINASQIRAALNATGLPNVLFVDLIALVALSTAFSNVSILQAMGVTVAPGVILALIYSAIFARRPNA
jgi:hypothetical protein